MEFRHARPGDFVYHSNDASHVVNAGKFGPKWEGPYEVTEALGDGAYKLSFTDGTVLPRTCNVANLKKSDGVPVSVPTVAPQGLAILLVDAATQTETSEDDASPRFLRSKSLPPMYNLDWP
nr:reverse transcriptase domain-containing protein [Tanacetum cinerariifolium]